VKSESLSGRREEGRILSDFFQGGSGIPPPGVNTCEAGIFFGVLRSKTPVFKRRGYGARGGYKKDGG
jgi:hypothetical protein